jgi:hypothetical protein
MKGSYDSQRGKPERLSTVLVFHGDDQARVEKQNQLSPVVLDINIRLSGS